MNRPQHSTKSHHEISRRQWLQRTGGGCLGLSLPGLFQARAAQADGATKKINQIRACIFIFYYGGPSHLDSFDPKPDAPAEIRGEFQSIPTTVPGVRVCEHLPRLAKLMHKVAFIRSMHHRLGAHDPASAETFTGRTPLSGDRPMASDMFPSHGACLSHLWQKKRLPLCHAALPFVMNNNGTRNPGQTPGFLGPACAPLEIAVDPITMSYRAEVLQVPATVTKKRLQERQALLDRLDESSSVQRHGPTGANSMRPHYEKAFHLLESEAVRRALDIRQEEPKVRDRYGLGPGDECTMDGPAGGVGAQLGFARNMRGQNLLLARRLVEAGVPFVNVYDFKQQGMNWDTHRDNFAQLRDHLLPPTDRALSALIEDLDARGLLDTTLVIALGEFGRAPRISSHAGRDHWPNCYTVVLAGGGVRGGAVYGESDRIAAYPVSDPVSPADLAATIFWRLGLDLTTELRDLIGRPYQLAEGQPIRKLFERTR